MRKGQAAPLTTVLLTLLGLSLIALLGGLFMSEGAANYGVTVDEEDFSGFSKMNSLNSTISEMSSNFVNEDGTPAASGFDVVTAMITGGYKVVILIFQTPPLYVDLFSDLATTVGIPPVVVGGFFLFIMVIIVMTAMYLIMRVRS